AGDVLIRRGEVERAIYIVIAGALEVVSVEGGAFGARVIPVPTGSVIGEIGFFDARPRSATVRAVTDGEVRRLDHEGYEALARSDPALARTLLFELGRIVAVRLRQTNEFIRGWLGVRRASCCSTTTERRSPCSSSPRSPRPSLAASSCAGRPAGAARCVRCYPSSASTVRRRSSRCATRIAARASGA